MEEWKPIPGYDGYEASSLGRVRSVDRAIVDKNGRQKNLRGVLLRPGPHSKSHPYPYIQAGSGNSLGVHVAVALAFFGPRPVGMYVCHKDGDETNNVPDNLYYGTPADNQRDRIAHGTKSVGEKHGRARLTRSQVDEIIVRLAAGERQSSIAKAYGVSSPQISHINTGRNWANENQISATTQ
jgi:uncharacterized protein (DUF433 family)